VTGHTKQQEPALTGGIPACRGKDFEHHERVTVDGDALRFHPIYVDGPLEGHDFPADSLYVQAIDYDAPGSTVWAMTADIVTYQLRQFGFHCGGKAVSFWIGSCSPGEPDAATVFRALFKPELFKRVEVFDMPPATSSGASS
jgi:hypothetical protein